MLTWTGLWLGVVRSRYRSSTHLGVSAVSVVVTCVCLGGRAANATGPSKHRLAACLLFLPLRGLAWFYLELARQLLTYALEPSKLPRIVKWMVELAEIPFKLGASINYKEASTVSRVVSPKTGPLSCSNFGFCGFQILLYLSQLSGSPQILAYLFGIEEWQHMANV